MKQPVNKVLVLVPVQL